MVTQSVGVSIQFVKCFIQEAASYSESVKDAFFSPIVRIAYIFCPNCWLNCEKEQTMSKHLATYANAVGHFLALSPVYSVRYDM